MHCPACGVEVVQQAAYCHKCGERLDEATESALPPAPPTDVAQAPATEALQNAAAGAVAQVEPERDLWRGGYSSKAMIAGWALSAVVTVLLLIVGILWVRDATYWLVLLAVILLPWLYHLAVLCYRRMSVRYLLTTQRFIHESGILRRVTNRIEVLDMDDITFEQGVLERLVGVGTIRIASSDRTDPQIALPGIEDVKRVSELFDDARRVERRRRGLHIEQI